MQDAVMLTNQELSEDSDRWIERHLYTWSLWMNGGRIADGYPEHTAGLKGFTHTDMDASYDSLDRWIAEVVSVCVEELPPAQWAAVHNRFGISMFRFPRGNEQELYLAAKLTLIPLLRKRNVV